jgi:hypothetical protein
MSAALDLQLMFHTQRPIPFPSMYGTTTTSELRTPLQGVSTPLPPAQGPVMHHSGQHPPILFLVFLLILCYGTSH